MSEAEALSGLKKKRATVRRAITRLVNSLTTLEANPQALGTVDHAKQLLTKLEVLDKDFRAIQFGMIELLDEESDDLERENEALEKHDDDVAATTLRIQKLVTPAASSVTATAERPLARKLGRVERSLEDTKSALAAVREDHDESPLLEQHRERLGDVKRDLSTLYDELISLDLSDDHDLLKQHVRLEQVQFDCSHRIKVLLNSRATPTSSSESTRTPSANQSSKLPKLDVPTFDGDVLNWQSFWEQFNVAVHSRSGLSDAEKLVYLLQAVKKGSARTSIDGLSHTGDQYGEAVDCLKARYSRPRLIHRAHVRAIMDIPHLKDDSGKELRRFHDVLKQHVRALKAMKLEPDPSFITSVIELKLDTTTLFEWQKHSHEKTEVPHYEDVLEFLDLRAQASETLGKVTKGDGNQRRPPRVFTGFGDSNPGMHSCVVCKTDKHPLYACTKFKDLPHDRMVSTVKENKLCMNCLRPGHFARQCKSQHKCRKCQCPHHTLLHVDPPADSREEGPNNQVSAHSSTGYTQTSLLMTCQVAVGAPDGSVVTARALLDSGSTASFISERLAHSLSLPRSSQSARISGVAGITHNSSTQSVTNVGISPLQGSSKKFKFSAIVVPRVTCDLPVRSVTSDKSWEYLRDLPLADPSFGRPSRIDLLLGVDIFVEALRPGRRTGPAGAPIAIETEFGWVLAGRTDPLHNDALIASHHVFLLEGDELLRRFWELEEPPATDNSYLPDEQAAVQHFIDTHLRTKTGRFSVPLLRKPDAQSLGESRSQAVRRFLSLERSLAARNQSEDFHKVMKEYFDMGHAEAVPATDLEKPPHCVFYLPMHCVTKECSTTTKLRAVFDASAKSSSGTSLNDTLVVGPTIHPPLIDVLIRFRMHRVALVADVSRMYRAVELVQSDRDYHRFVWREDPGQPLVDYRMTRVTFGVSASSFIANMSVKQNAKDYAHQYPAAAAVVDKSLYVDDALTGADSVDEAIELRDQLQCLFNKGGFLLRKWNSSEPDVLQYIPSELKDSESLLPIPCPEEYSKTLGIQWNSGKDHFRLTVSQQPPLESLTKRSLISDVAKTYDVLGWFTPAIILVKILFQQLWELKLEWDDPVPQTVKEEWLQWRVELPLLTGRHIPRCYFPKQVHIVQTELHGFSDASERAYAGVVYLRMVDSTGGIHVSLVMAKSKVAPIKRLTVPRLELNGAQLLAKLLHHLQDVLHIAPSDTYAWTDSTIVLSWLTGNPRRLKTYVGNRVASIIELVHPDHWNHVSGIENPADCASRGVLPSQLLEHPLWWKGPDWLQQEHSCWPMQSSHCDVKVKNEEKEISFHTTVAIRPPVLPLQHYSSFTTMKRVTAWVLRFIHNCKGKQKYVNPFLTIPELNAAENYWVRFAQQDDFPDEVEAIQNKSDLPASSCLRPLHPFLDSDGILRVGGRECNSNRSFASKHPYILRGSHPLTKLIIRAEHLRLLHGGATLLRSSLGRRIHIINPGVIRSITRSCVTCRRNTTRPQPQLMGQLPVERVTPGAVFDQVGVDFAGPIYTKFGHTRKPTVVKSYVCVFVALSVKAVHIEAVTDLSTEAFLAAMRRFISRRGKPNVVMSDHGTNFIGAKRELKELYKFLQLQKTQGAISNFCSTQGIQWSLIPEHAPHFGGIWEAAVKSFKTHLRRVTSNVKLTFEELTTVLAQIESCLNSRPLVPLPSNDDGVEALTPGHFLIGRPLEALPDGSQSYFSISLLRRWHLCQTLIRQFWSRWSSEYLATLRRFAKWHQASPNVHVGDVVLLREDGLVPTKWPIGRIIKVYPGNDGHVRVASVKTSSGTYRRPVTKIAPLVASCD